MRTEQLRDVAHQDGPFISVYLDVSHDTEDATTQNELRWRAAETELREQGADQTTIDAAKQAVLDSPAVGSAGRAIVAAHGTVLLTEELPVPPPAEVVRCSALPYLLPLLSSVEPSVPHVVVLADKTGARVRAVDENGATAEEVTVQGQDRPVHHVGAGGSAHGSMANRAEETLRRNAKDIAEQAVRAVAGVGAQLLVLAGTISARTAIHGELPKHIREFSIELDIDATHTGLDDAQLRDGVARLVAQRQAEADDALLERLQIGRAHGRACEGLGDVTTALRAGAVDTILVTDPTLASRTVWLGEDRSQIAISADVLREAGEQPVERRSDEAVPAAALATSAEVLVLTGAATATDGLAALLRF
ncbi:MAG TPA: hypothetical protein VGN81_40185 [Pseudonocardiaceae bacterium]